MIKFKIPAEQIRAALIHVAKGDVRYFLCGIHVAKNNDVVSTNDHTLFLSDNDVLNAFDNADGGFDLSECYEYPEDGIILDTSNKWPILDSKVKYVGVEIDYGTETANISYHVFVDKQLKTARQTVEFAVKLIGAKFPDYQRVMPTRNDSEPTPTIINFSPALLATIAKTFPRKNTGVSIEIFGANTAIKITSKYSPTFILIIMPCRV